MAPKRHAAVIPFRPRISEIQGIVRAAAADSRKVAFGDHALDRMEERGITTLDALRVLQKGEIVGDLEPGRRQGEWKCKVVHNLRGSRDIGVITIVMLNGRLFIKTVEWEDL